MGKSVSNRHDHNIIRRELQALFQEADDDSSGTIGIDEFIQLMKNWNESNNVEEGEMQSEEFVRAIFDEIDINRDGELSFVEFAGAFEAIVERNGCIGSPGDLGSHLSGIEAAEFRVALQRSADLEQDLVMQKLQHLAEIRERKEMSKVMSDQLEKV